MTTGKYLQHHLHHLKLDLLNCRLDEHAHGFWVIHLDTLLISWLLAGLLFAAGHFVVKHFVARQKPERLQASYELILKSGKNLVKTATPDKWPFAVSIALTSMLWIFAMNCMDLIPVDLFPSLLNLLFGIDVFRMTPTADPNMTFALSLTVFALMLYFNVQKKGIFSFIYEVCARPFGLFLFPANIALRLLDECVKPISLAMRLYGNLFAGKVIFILISCLPMWAQWAVNCLWSLMHIGVSFLQAFIFGILMVIYLKRACENH